MAVIKKIKIPGETLPRDIGVNSSNVVYDGDSGTTTTLNSKIQSIFTAIGDINSFEIALVNALPTENIDDHTIYFVPNSQDANTRDEYMYVGNQWEMIGSTTIDLSDYPTYDDISIVQGLTTGIPAATITVGATTTTIFSNDAPVQSDWTQATTTSLDYIKNKPAIWKSPNGTNAVVANSSNNLATGNYSWVEGNQTTGTKTVDINGVSTTLSIGASGNNSHAEGYYNIVSGVAAHVEGSNNVAYGASSHAEGNSNIASKNYSHVEGNNNVASGLNSHAEGSRNTASGSDAHAEGCYNTASGNYSHAEGEKTVAAGRAQHVFGRYNIAETVSGPSSMGQYVEIVGNGNYSGVGSTTYSNARTLDWNGNEILAGKLTVGVTPTANMDVATKGYVDTAISNVPSTSVTVTQGITTGITIGSIDVSGTTTVFYAPESKEYIVTFTSEYDSENDEYVVSCDKTINEIVTKYNNGYNISAKYYTLIGQLAYVEQNDDQYNLSFLFYDVDDSSAAYKYIYMYTEDGSDIMFEENLYFPSAPDSEFIKLYDQSSLETLYNNSYKYVKWECTADAMNYMLIHDSVVSGSNGYTTFVFLGVREVVTVNNEILTTLYTRTISYNTNTYESIKNNTILSLSTKTQPYANQVQADWNQSIQDSKDYINNKPTKLSQFTNDTNFINFNSATETFDLRYIQIRGDDYKNGDLTFDDIDSPKQITISNDAITFRLGDSGGFTTSLSYSDIRGTTPRLTFGRTTILNMVSTPEEPAEAANKQYVDDQINSVTSTIPSITATAGLTTGVTIGAIDINGITTTLYAPEDTKVTQTDITGSTGTVKYPVLLSAQTITAGTITDTAVKSDEFVFNKQYNVFIVSGNGSNNSGGFYINDNSSRRNQISMIVNTAGTSTTPGMSMLQVGNAYDTSDGAGNSSGRILIMGTGKRGNQLRVLDNSSEPLSGGGYQYIQYLPAAEGILTVGATTGVGSSTVPVYMASTGELLACTLPTSASYSLSMTGPTINLLADGVAASTITLPIYDGTVIEAAEGGSY